ncbi:hypothetical protein, partial [Clostridium sp. M62/1]|uniref:hypothetical protein n=1 Tax=Clostridium sp. M62/1 TaxID=411486 RepID=UPI00356A5A21
ERRYPQRRICGTVSPEWRFRIARNTQRYLNFQYPVILRLLFGTLWQLSDPSIRKFLEAAVDWIKPIRDAEPDSSVSLLQYAGK